MLASLAAGRLAGDGGAGGGSRHQAAIAEVRGYFGEGGESGDGGRIYGWVLWCLSCSIEGLSSKGTLSSRILLRATVGVRPL